MKKHYIIIPFILLALISITFGAKSKKLNISYSPIETNFIQTLEHTTLKVFIENSGSMDGYMCEGSEFKDAIKGYISSLESEFNKIELYYINSQIISRPNNIKSFISDLTPTTFRQAGGNRANSDMGQLLETVIANTNDSVVSIFVSDCILDIPQVATDYFTDRQIDVTNAVKKFAKRGNNSIEIIQLKSQFKGNYYGIDGISKLNDSRPYYIWILGRNDLLAAMNQSSPIKEIKHGALNWISFSKHQQIPFEIKNQFGQAPQKIISTNGAYKIVINANLSSLLKSEQLLAMPSNYSSKNYGAVRVESISPKLGDKQYSHVLTLSIDDNIPSCSEQICYIDANKVPDWVETINDNTGKNIHNNMDKTTGIKYLINGVAEAYKAELTLGEINFIIKNN